MIVNSGAQSPQRLYSYIRLPPNHSKFKYTNAIYHRDNLYFTPCHANNIGIYNLSTCKFTEISTTPLYGPFLFWGSVLVKDIIYYAPHDCSHIGILDTLTLQFSFVDISSHVDIRDNFYGVVHVDEKLYFGGYGKDILGIYDLKTKKFSILDLNTALNGRSYRGIVKKDKKIYLIPSNSDNIGIYNTLTKEFRKLDIKKVGFCKFNGGLALDDKIYMIPNRSDDICVYDTKTHDIEYISINHVVSGNFKFVDAVVFKRTIVFCPYLLNDLVILDCDKKQIKVDRKDWYRKYGGCVVVDEKIYFTPYDGENLGVLSNKVDNKQI